MHSQCRVFVVSHSQFLAYRAAARVRFLRHCLYSQQTCHPERKGPQALLSLGVVSRRTCFCSSPLFVHRKICHPERSVLQRSRRTCCCSLSTPPRTCHPERTGPQAYFSLGVVSRRTCCCSLSTPPRTCHPERSASQRSRRTCFSALLLQIDMSIPSFAQILPSGIVPFD